MTLLGNIRKKAGNICIVIAIVCCILLIGEGVSSMVQYFFPHNQVEEIGCVDGVKISVEDYRAYCQYIFKAYTEKPTEKAQMYIKQIVWDRLINKELYDKEIKQLGIAISEDELIDLVQGDRVHEKIKALFKDFKTDSLDQKKLHFLHQVEKDLCRERAVNKLHQLMMKSRFVTALEEAHKTKHREMLCDVAYLSIPFTTVDDDLVTLTEQQLQEYLLNHRAYYTRVTDSRSVQYIAFPIQPDEKDKNNFQKALHMLTAQFSTATDPYYFAKQNTDGNLADTRLECSTATLPKALAAIKHSLQKDMLVGPVTQGNYCMLYRVMEISTKADGSVAYQMAVIAKKESISARTRNQYYRQVEAFAAKVKNLSDFNAMAEKEGIAMGQEVNITPADSSLGSYAEAKQAIRWLYTQAKVGKISPIFEIEDVYLLVMMTEKVKKGNLPSLYSPSVYSNVYNKVLNEAKAEIILTRLNQLQATTLPAIAEQYKEQPIEIKFATGLNFCKKNEDQELDRAQVFKGSCFGLEPATISKPIVDQVAGAVWIACVKNKHRQIVIPSESEDDSSKQVEGLASESHYVSKSMEELANIIDKRYNAE